MRRLSCITVLFFTVVSSVHSDTTMALASCKYHLEQRTAEFIAFQAEKELSFDMEEVFRAARHSLQRDSVISIDMRPCSDSYFVDMGSLMCEDYNPELPPNAATTTTNKLSTEGKMWIGYNGGFYDEVHNKWIWKKYNTKMHTTYC